MDFKKIIIKLREEKRGVRSVDRRDIFGRRTKDKEENNEHMT